MLAKTVFPAILLAAGMATAVETIPAAEATKILSDLYSYKVSLSANPSVQSIASVVISDLGGTASASSILATLTATTTYGFSEFAEHPSSILTARPQDWETALPSSVRSVYDAAVTSEYVAQASIIAEDLGDTKAASLATTSATASASVGTSGAASVASVGVWGVAAGLLGAATFIGAVL